MANRARRPIRLAAGLAIAVIGALTLLAAPAARAQANKPARPPAASAPAAPAVDVEALLRACPAEAQRNAKLYAVRAHGIDLMRRSADRHQARSAVNAEQQMSGLIEQLHGKPNLGADVQRVEDALTGLTELTIQEPLVAQIPAVEGLADQAAKACQSLIAALKLNHAAPGGSPPEVVSGLHFLAQRLGRTYLAAQLTRQLTPPVIAALADDVTAFETLLGALRQAGDADTKLRDATVMITGQWVFMKVALTQPRDAGRTRLEDVGRASEHLFELLQEQSTRLHAKQRSIVARR